MRRAAGKARSRRSVQSSDEDDPVDRAGLGRRRRLPAAVVRVDADGDAEQAVDGTDPLVAASRARTVRRARPLERVPARGGPGRRGPGERDGAEQQSAPGQQTSPVGGAGVTAVARSRSGSWSRPRPRRSARDPPPPRTLRTADAAATTTTRTRWRTVRRVSHRHLPARGRPRRRRPPPIATNASSASAGSSRRRLGPVDARQPGPVAQRAAGTPGLQAQLSRVAGSRTGLVSVTVSISQRGRRRSSCRSARAPNAVGVATRVGEVGRRDPGAWRRRCRPRRPSAPGTPAPRV